MNQLEPHATLTLLLLLLATVSYATNEDHVLNRSLMIDSARRAIDRLQPDVEYSAKITCPQDPNKNTTYVQYCSVLIGEFTTNQQYLEIVCIYNAQLSEYVCRFE